MVISQQDLSILYIYLYLFAKDNMKYTDYQVNMISISMLLGKRIKVEKGNINKILLFLKIGKFDD